MKSILVLISATISLSLFTIFSGYVEASDNKYFLVKKGTLAPQIIADNGKPRLIAASFIKRRLRLQYPTLKDIFIGDTEYLFITEKWFMGVVAWTDYFIKLQVPELDTLPEYPKAYVGTFTMLVSNLANLAVARRNYNVKASVLIGLLVAKSDKPWGEIPADGKPRGYIVCLTKDGSIIYDIPTQQSISGDRFPNRESITGIMF